MTRSIHVDLWPRAHMSEKSSDWNNLPVDLVLSFVPPLKIDHFIDHLVHVRKTFKRYDFPHTYIFGYGDDHEWYGWLTRDMKNGVLDNHSKEISCVPAWLHYPLFCTQKKLMTHMCINTHTNTKASTHIQTHMHAHAHAYLYAYTHVLVCTHICAPQTCMNKGICCFLIQTHKCTYIQTHRYTYITPQKRREKNMDAHTHARAQRTTSARAHTRMLPP